MKCTLLAILTFAASALFAAEPQTVEIRLGADRNRAFVAQRGKPLGLSPNRATQFRIVPGLTLPNLVSLEMIASNHFYVRHQNYVVYVQEHPKPPKVNPLFDADATFKMHRSSDDKVRFEASNKPGCSLP